MALVDVVNAPMDERARVSKINVGYKRIINMGNYESATFEFREDVEIADMEKMSPIDIDRIIVTESARLQGLALAEISSLGMLSPDKFNEEQAKLDALKKML